MKLISIKSLLLMVSLSLFGCSQKMQIVKAYERNSNRLAIDSDDYLFEGSLRQFHQGQLDSAKAGFQQIVQTNKADWRACYYLGLIQIIGKNYQQAIVNLTSALNTTGDNRKMRSNIYLKLGQCWEFLLELPKAEQNFLMALNLQPEFAEASAALKRISQLRINE